MKKLFILFVMAILIAGIIAPAFAAGTFNAYWVRVEDEQGNPVTSGTVTVYDASTVTTSTIYSDELGSSAISNAAITIDSTSGIAKWWGTASSYDIIADIDTQQVKLSAIDTGNHRVIIPKTLENRTTVTFKLPGTTAATTANYNTPILIATEDMELVSVKVRYGTAADGGDKVMLVKAASGTAISSGTEMLASYIDCTQTADTNYSGTLNSTLSNIRCSDGDIIAMRPSGDMGSCAGFNATVELKKR